MRATPGMARLDSRMRRPERSCPGRSARRYRPDRKSRTASMASRSVRPARSARSATLAHSTRSDGADTAAPRRGSGTRRGDGRPKAVGRSADDAEATSSQLACWQCQDTALCASTPLCRENTCRIAASPTCHNAPAAHGGTGADHRLTPGMVALGGANRQRSALPLCDPGPGLRLQRRGCRGRWAGAAACGPALPLLPEGTQRLLHGGLAPLRRRGNVLWIRLIGLRPISRAIRIPSAESRQRRLASEAVALVLAHRGPPLT